MRAPALAAAALALALLVGPASAGHAVSAGGTLSARGEIAAISADGGHVVVHVHPTRGCDYGSIWTPSTGAVVHIEDCGSSDAVMSNLTLAGNTAIWWDWSSGNHVYCDDVYTATIEQPKPHPLGICDGTMGDDYFSFAGDRTLVTINDYSVCESDCVGADGGLLRDGDYGVEVRRIRSGRLATVLGPRDFRTVLDARNWRVAVIEPKAILTVYDMSGKLLWRTPGVSGVLRGWIVGNSVVVQRGRSVQVYSAGSGVIPTRSLPKGARLNDVAGGLALYTVGSSVHLLRLSDGRDRRLVTTKGLVGAQLTPAGVFYAYNLPGTGANQGRVIFVPIAEALQALR
jgi:hypothetical protein